MPLIIALLLRKVIMTLVTAGGVTVAQELFNGTLKQLVFEIQDKEGVTETDAKDILKNILADMATNSVTVGAFLYAKLPVKAAEFLGLTSKGLVKKTLTGKAAQVSVKLAAEGGEGIVKSAIPKILKVAAIPSAFIWLVSAIANIVEPGIYKPEQTNAVYRKLGIPFQYPEQQASLKPGPFSADSSVTFSDFAKAIETQGIKGFNNTFAQQTQLYSRQALADLVNAIYGEGVTSGKAYTVKEIIQEVGKYTIGGVTNNINVPVVSTGGTTIPTTKVFTGIVSQGVVGKGLVFTARPDDLIESIEELRTAAANNLAPYLNTLLGKIVYEVKIVSSIVTKEGFKQTGMAQRIQTGTYSNGQAKYKTVTNKFATLVVYALTDKGTRAKLTTIVLGPTDSSKLSVAQTDLRELESNLPADVTTTDINDVLNITGNLYQVEISDNADGYEVIMYPPGKTPDPSLRYPGAPEPSSTFPTWKPGTAPVVPVVPMPVVPVTNGSVYWDILNIQNVKYKIGPFTNRAAAANAFSIVQKQYDDIGVTISGMPVTTGEPSFPVWISVDQTGVTKSSSVPVTVPAVSSATPNPAKPGASATTLSEWFQAQGQSLPSVKDRAQKYQELGLGQASYYTGTAEQNTKLLNALKNL